MNMFMRRVLIVPGLTIGLIIGLIIGMSTANRANAAISDCGNATLLEHAFSSGASWSLCAQANDTHALEVTSVHYRAPGGILRSVLAQAHVSQILMHYHDEPTPRAQINDESLSRLLPMSSTTCDGSLLLADVGSALVCSRILDNRILAKYAQRPSLQSQRWELSSSLQNSGLIWTTSLSFTEDGQIMPAVSLSGRARETLTNAAFSASLPASRRHLARATVLATWRLVFNLDDAEFDEVQQFDFPLNEGLGNRRPMQVTQFDTEVFTTVKRDNFRGWRIYDPGGTGYYLDPSNSGFNFLGSGYNWARFDLAVTGNKPCEQYALNNKPVSESSQACGASLDDFVSGESLQGTHPVLWFSQTRTFNPANEDWPAISNFNQSFTLLPYDWTPSSPFEVIE